MFLLNVKLDASDSCLKLADPFLLSFCRASNYDSWVQNVEAMQTFFVQAQCVLFVHLTIVLDHFFSIYKRKKM